MKVKLLIIILAITCITVVPAFSTEVTTGLTYDFSNASFSYTKFLSVALLSGGFNYDIKTSGIPQNTPDMYSCSADVIFDTKNRIIDLSFLYSFQKKNAKTENKIGGGFVFTAYEQRALADILKPRISFGQELPYTISLSTEFKL